MADLRQFRQFIVVAEELNFRRAAERLHMAQPPLTAAIKKLEDELGVLLIERGNRIHRLTAAGEAFLLESSRALAQAQRAVEAARRASLGQPKPLRIGFVDSTIPRLLPQLLLTYRQRHPEAAFHLEEATTADQLLALQEDRLDLGLVVLPIGSVTPELQVEPILRTRMVLALPESHHLSRRRKVHLCELASDPWVMFPAHYGPGMHGLILKACAQAGFAPNVMQHARQMQTTAGLIAGGMGVALMPSLYLNAVQPRGVIFKELYGEGVPIAYELAMLYQQESISSDFKTSVRQAAKVCMNELVNLQSHQPSLKQKNRGRIGDYSQ